MVIFVVGRFINWTGEELKKTKRKPLKIKLYNIEIIYKIDPNLVTLNLVIETVVIVQNINIKAEEN